MGPMTGSTSIIHIDDGIPDGFVEGGGTKVGRYKVMGFISRAEPHFGNVERHGITCAFEACFDFGRGGVEQSMLVVGDLCGVGTCRSIGGRGSGSIVCVGIIRGRRRFRWIVSSRDCFLKGH